MRLNTQKTTRRRYGVLVSLSHECHRKLAEQAREALRLRVGDDLAERLDWPLGKIVADLRAADSYGRGLAVEALGLRLMRFLDLEYVTTPLRGFATGGSEARLLFHSSRFVHPRWQVQCKNTASVALDDVAKEVGLTHMLKSNVIVVVGTGDIGSVARRYVNKVMTDSNLCVVLLDGRDVTLIEKNPSAIVDVFNREAAHAMKLKALEL
jgi:site-specific DNA-methyltransferase (cytosine-N4-specific)